MTNLLVIGSSGQFARALRYGCPDATFLDRAVLDLSKPNRVLDVISRYEPDAIINAAAYTQVDNAEKEEALATAVNAESPGIMADYCASRSIPFVSFSSDYVFDGNGGTPWKETALIEPLNAYGRSKAVGEKRIAAAGGKYLLFRTSWLYDDSGKNFLNTILRLASERDELRVIDDQYGAPTYAMHLATAVLSILEKAMAQEVFPSGIYHLCNSGVTTWHGFASAIVEHAKKYTADIKVKNIQPIPASEYPLPAKRPFNSRLDCSKVQSVFNVVMPDWNAGLAECMKVKYENNGLPA